MVIRTSVPTSATSVMVNRACVGDRFDAEVCDGEATGPEQCRCDVRDDLVDQPGREEGRGQRRTALQPDMLTPAVIDLLEYDGRVAAGQDQGFGGIVEDSCVGREVC